jgi:rubredoxin
MAGETKDPKCPECGTTPLRFNYSNQIIGNGAVITNIWCSDCGHVFSLTQIGQMPPKISHGIPPIIRGHG